MSVERKHIPELDGLRGVAILQVLLWHYFAQLPGEFVFVKTLTALTWSGVDLFFVLSGFLIGGILLNHRSAPNRLRAFYARRFFRIVPLYALFVTLGFGLSLLGARSQQHLPNAAWYLTFTQNFWMVAHGWPTWLPQSWSLAVEEHFYVLLPAAIWFVKGRWLPWLLGALITSAPLFRFLLTTYAGDYAFMAGYVLLPFRMDALLMGVLCAYWLRQPAVAQWLGKHVSWLYALFGALLVACIMMVANGYRLRSDLMTVVGYSALAALYSTALVLIIVDRSGPLGWLMRFNVLRQLGVWSYFLYLAHDIIPAFTFKVFGLSPHLVSLIDGVILVGSIALMLAAASLSRRYFEGPLINQGRRVQYANATLDDTVLRRRGLEPLGVRSQVD